MQGKNESFLKLVLKKTLIVQNTRFSRLSQVACKSPGQVVRNLRRNFWKICLSVFHNWKFHPRGSRERSLENFCVTFTIGASAHKQVANLSREKPKNPNFEKFSKSFLGLGHWPASELRKPIAWARDWGNATRLTCDQVAKIGQHCFWKFWQFL